MPDITGRSYLPKSTTPRTGKWTLRLDPSSVSGVPGMGTTGTSDVVSGTVTARDNGTGATITGLVTGWYFARFEPDTSDEQAPDDGPTDWLRFNLTANTTWKAIVESQPVGPPPTPTLAQQAAASRAGAEAAKSGAEAAQAQAEAARDETLAVGSTSDAVTASNLANPASATRAALDAAVDDSIGDALLPYARTANRPVTLRDSSTLDFTGASDSSGALQAAINAAGAGTPIEIGRSGVIRCDSGVTLQQFQRLSGPTQYHGVGGTAAAEIRFPNHTGTMVGITGGGNNTLTDLVVRGPMTGANDTVGYSSITGAPRFRRVSFLGWAIGTSVSSAYYTVFDQCEWSRNKYGLVNGAGVAQNYNLHLISPRFFCRYGSGDSLLGYGIAGGARGLVVTGGSMEGYGPGGAITLASNQSLTMAGTYFEVMVSGAGSYGINATGVSRVNLDLRGCMVYLNHHARWVHIGSSTEVTINSSGNKFNCSAGSSPSAPDAYYFNSGDVANIRGRIGHDDWSETTGSSASYVPSAIASLGQLASLEMRRPGVTYIAGDVAGTGSPEGVVFGRIGQIYRRLDGGASTSIYVKTSGNGTNTGWTAK